MKILVLNSGSSSIKYCLYKVDDLQVLTSGMIEKIASAESVHKFTLHNGPVETEYNEYLQLIADHAQGLQVIFQQLLDLALLNSTADLYAIGHRVVHGGEKFQQPTIISTQALSDIKSVSDLAPLHNPANISGIELCFKFAANIPQVAVFDTAFHQSMPPQAFHYAIPRQYYLRDGVRRYGFHGTSHAYVSGVAARMIGKQLSSCNLISLHLGNGSSVTAIKQGKSIDTSMGMTPLEGLIMGTRCGDIDPAVLHFLNQKHQLCSHEIDAMLNQESGLKGVCGENDMRTIHDMADSGDQLAELAIDMFCYRIKKYIGAYYAVLGRVDALIFTGGIGENDNRVREQVCQNLQQLGIILEPEKNKHCQSAAFAIHAPHSEVSVLVIPTNEELEIAKQALQCVQDAEKY